MGTAQVEFTEAELLSNLAVAEPLIAGGVHCHGGFDDQGTYVSPRTKFRAPAIAAWGEQNCERFETELIDVPLERWQRSFPNVAQARYLIAAGVPEPLMATLTRIGTVEGYGANIRLLKPKDLQRHFVEDVRGTAIDHLGAGLFEAHGRDEAGWDEEAGHRDMWFAARDIAFERPTEELNIEAMLARMGFGPGRPGAGRRRGNPPAPRRHRARPRDDGHAHGARPLHRDLRLPHLRLGRGVDVRHRARGRRRRSGQARLLHPGRRDAPRRLPAHRPLRDAGPHLARRHRSPARRQGHDRAHLGPPPGAQPGARPRGGSARHAG